MKNITKRNHFDELRHLAEDCVKTALTQNALSKNRNLDKITKNTQKEQHAQVKPALKKELHAKCTCKLGTSSSWFCPQGSQSDPLRIIQNKYYVVIDCDT